MKLHGLVVGAGGDTVAQGLTGSLPCSLTASNSWDLFIFFFRLRFFVTSVIFLQGVG